jgi:hypothetical protein
MLSTKRCVEKGKDEHALKFFKILCFQNEKESLKNSLHFVVNGCYKK